MTNDEIKRITDELIQNSSLIIKNQLVCTIEEEWDRDLVEESAYASIKPFTAVISSTATLNNKVEPIKVGVVFSRSSFYNMVKIKLSELENIKAGKSSFNKVALLTNTWVFSWINTIMTNALIYGDDGIQAVDMQNVETYEEYFGTYYTAFDRSIKEFAFKSVIKRLRPEIIIDCIKNAYIDKYIK